MPKEEGRSRITRRRATLRPATGSSDALPYPSSPSQRSARVIEPTELPQYQPPSSTLAPTSASGSCATGRRLLVKLKVDPTALDGCTVRKPSTDFTEDRRTTSPITFDPSLPFGSCATAPSLLVKLHLKVDPRSWAEGTVSKQNTRFTEGERTTSPVPFEDGEGWTTAKLQAEADKASAKVRDSNFHPNVEDPFTKFAFERRLTRSGAAAPDKGSND